MCRCDRASLHIERGRPGMSVVWQRIAAADPLCLPALAHLSAAATISALQEEKSGQSSGERIAAAEAAVQAAFAACYSFNQSRWTLLGPDYSRRYRALLVLHRALLLDFCKDECTAARREYSTLTLAGLDDPDRRVWQLHAACAARDPSISEAALELPQASNIHEEAVARGLWLRVEQRPLQLVPICAEGATPWLDPSTHPACVVLEKNYEKIRAEALRLLERSNEGGIWKQERADASVRGLAVLTGGGLIDGQQQQQPAPPRGLTAAGSWQDVTFYMNGKKHEAHAELAPFTSRLLASTEGNMRRDSTSCVYGSAFLSLLAPGTRLRPHCGPTNIRLRAHLPLLVPEGDCMMRVGNDPPRKWIEGKVCLFDDSFEHEVWNSTDKPRLVLIVDLWHPKLDTDEKRLSTLDPFRAERYLKVLDPSCALERGDVPKASETASSSSSAAGGSSSSSSSGSGGGSEDGVNLPTVNGSSPLIDLLIEKEERALGGPHGVQALLHCLDQPACPVPVAMPVGQFQAGMAPPESPDTPVAIAKPVGAAVVTVATPVAAAVATPVASVSVATPVEAQQPLPDTPLAVPVALPSQPVAVPVPLPRPTPPDSPTHRELRALLLSLLQGGSSAPAPAYYSSSSAASSSSNKRPRSEAEDAEAAGDARMSWGFDASRVRTLIRGIVPTCRLIPSSYFIAWNGVIVLVYAGFPPPIASLKASLNDPSNGFPFRKEGFGSKWPKTTLGALRDDATPLTLEELARLRALCVEHASGLFDLRVPLTSLSLVKYKARGLEAGPERKCSVIPLTASTRAVGSSSSSITSPPLHNDQPSEEEASRVSSVLSEWSDLDEYLPKVNAAGSRMSTYREASPSGSTLVSFLELRPASELAKRLNAFRLAVEALLPARYAWLSDESLHCTVRALDGGAG